MKGQAVFVLLAVFGASLPADAAQSKFVNELTSSLRNLERRLCQQFPSKKCHRSQRVKVSSKSQAASQEPRVIEAKKAEQPVPQVKERASPITQQKISVREKIPVPVPKPERVVRKKHPVVAKDMPEQPQSQESVKPATKPKSAMIAAATPIGKPAYLPPGSIDMEICLRKLQVAGVSFAPAAVQVSTSGCDVSNPVKLNSITAGGTTVKLPDQPVVACTFALQLAGWIAASNSVEDGRHLAALWTGPGFQCRGRNGDASGKLSEHAYGNAIDIERLRLSDGSTIWVTDALKPGSTGFTHLQRLRASACTTFTTVLGPGANAAHESHLHFDLEKRGGGFRICQ